MSGVDTPNQMAFEQVVAKLALREGFMAHVLHRAFAGDVSAARIARELGCDEAAAIRLALMRTPSTDRFRSDVAKMAADVGIDATQLSSTIRQASALSAFDTPSASGLLMAARDRHDDDEER